MNLPATERKLTVLQLHPLRSVVTYYIASAFCTIGLLPGALPRLLGGSFGGFALIPLCVGPILIMCLFRHLRVGMPDDEGTQFWYIVFGTLGLFIVDFLALVIGVLLGFVGMTASL